MPRAVVKLSPAPEAPPDWWADEFRSRQATLRSRIMERMPKIGRAMTGSEIQQNFGSAAYRACEIKHMLDLLVSQKLLRRFDRDGLTFYELTRKAR